MKHDKNLLKTFSYLHSYLHLSKTITENACNGTTQGVCNLLTVILDYPLDRFWLRLATKQPMLPRLG